MATIDRRGVSVDATDTAIAGGPNPGLAIKTPALAATTGDITLSGLQTIDGVALLEGNRVLVWQQADASQNGLWNASSGPWTRTIDADSNDKIASGLQVSVTSGTTFTDKIFLLTTPDPIALGTTAIHFVVAGVPFNRRVDTTAPLEGGGDLSANRTLSIETNGIGYGLIQQVSATKILGNPANAAATASEIGLGATLLFAAGALVTAALTGDVAAAQNSFATTIQPNVVSYAKLQQIAASSLVGNPTGVLANAQGITLGATLAFSGTALQTAAATGDITWSANSFVTAIGANKVLNSMIRQSAGLSLIGNATNATANVADITAGSDNQVLRRSGTAIGFGAVNLASSAAVTGTLASANGGTDNATYAIGDLLQASAATPTLSRLAAVATGNALMSGGVGTVSSWGKIGLTTHVTGTLAAANGGTGATSLGSEFTVTTNVLHVANNGITYALFQQVAASSLVGNATGAPATATGITLGATLTFSGSALQTTAHTGDVTSAANSNAMTIAANAVTNAKMATMADGTIKANISGATAVPTDSTITAVLDKLFGTTQGSIIYRGASAWAALGPGSSGQVLGSGGPAANPAWQAGAAGARSVLTGNASYFVNASTGSDSNAGTSSGAAFQTLQKALNVVFGTLDLGGFNATINLADGTYSTTVPTTVTGAQVGAGTVSIIGNTTTPANVIVTCTADNTLVLSGYGALTIDGLELRSGGAYGAKAVNGFVLTVGNHVRCGTCSAGQLFASQGGKVIFGTAIAIVGGATAFLTCADESLAILSGCTATLSGTPAFTTFVVCSGASVIEAVGMTFAGTGATGVRFSVATNGVINTGGGGASYFPGNAAGTGTNSGTTPFGLYL